MPGVINYYHVFKKRWQIDQMVQNILLLKNSKFNTDMPGFQEKYVFNIYYWALNDINSICKARQNALIL